MSRRKFFQHSLQRLAAAADGGFEELERQCMEEQLQYCDWPVISFHGGAEEKLLRNCPCHKYSLSIMPLSVKSEYIPLWSLADGNCLYRYSCIHIFA